MKTREKKKLVLITSIVLIGAVAPSLAIVSNATGTDASKLQAEDPALATRVAASIRAEVDARPATASVEDLEGVIVFALSREDYSATVINRALDIVASGPNVTDSLKQAIANVRLAMLRRKLKRGTGALATGTGGFGGGGGSSFSAPIVSVGGGSSNYAS